MIVVKKKGPLGGNNGPNPYDDAVFNPNDQQVYFDDNLEIGEIHIAYGWYIDSIQIYYRDKRDGSLVPGGKHGGNGGRVEPPWNSPDPIVLQPGEHVLEIYVTYGSWVNTLTITTNMNLYSTYGGGDGSHVGPNNSYLGVVDPNTQQIVGFFGTCGDFIDGIGIDYIP